MSNRVSGAARAVATSVGRVTRALAGGVGRARAAVGSRRRPARAAEPGPAAGPSWLGPALLAVVVGAAVLLAVPGHPAHRPAAVVLGVALLALVARTFSVAVLRVTALVVALAALGALAQIGDRAVPPGPSAQARTEARRALDGVSDEADSLQDDLPCDDPERPIDRRLCAALADLADRAGEAADDAEVAAVSPARSELAARREEVAVRLLPRRDEPPARVELTADRNAADAFDTQGLDDPEPVEAPDVRELVATGGDRVLDDALDPLLGERTELRLGPWGWVALLLLVGLAYRRLEVANDRRHGGPIGVASVVTPVDEEPLGPELCAAIRNRIAELDLREPALVPGGGPASPATVSIGAPLADREAGPAGVRAVRAVGHATLFPPAGVTVEATYARALKDDGEGTDHVVTARLVAARDGEVLGARSFARPSAQAAAAAAADYVACHALARSRVVPSWARWLSDDGAALGPYEAVLADRGRTGPRLALGEQIELLETARAASPATGLVLVELGHRYDLDERPLDALRAHLTARLLHPRFVQARYRVATSLAMLAGPGRLGEHWLDPGRADRRRQIADLLVESGLVDGARRSRWWRMVAPRCPVEPEELAAWLAQPEPSQGAQREIVKVLLLVARNELRSLERHVGLPGVLAGAARQSERRVWLARLAHPGRRRAERLGYRSARWICELRLALIPTQPGTKRARQLGHKVEAMARRRGVGSTALYNAACFTSILADRSPQGSTERADLAGRAIRYLERVVRGGLGPVPSSGWLTTDPDLTSLQAVPAFNDLARRLAHDEDRRAVAAEA